MSDEPVEPAPPPLPSDPDARLEHETEDTLTYPCRSCGGEMEFAIDTQRLACPHCGTAQDIVLDQVAVVEQDLQAALARLTEVSHDAQPLADEKEIVCQNCGGHTTFVGTLTSTRCPYCATPIQRDDVHRAPTRLAVDGVLPFRVDEDAAHVAVKKWITSRWFAPNEFKQYSKAGSFASVYAAYFTFDADTVSDYAGRRGDHYTVTVGSGENRRTETRTRWRRVKGTVWDRFDDVPVLANTGFQDKHVAKLEPWPTGDAVPFSQEFLAGHLCRTYDHPLAECFDRAKARMAAEIHDSVERDIGGDVQDVSWIRTRWNDLGYKHLLLPVWLLTVVFAGTTYQVFMNGVTGEVHGQRPYSPIKIAVAVVLALIVVIGLVLAFQSSGQSP